MLYVCYLVFKGALEQTRINMDVLAPPPSCRWPWFTRRRGLLGLGGAHAAAGPVAAVSGRSGRRLVMIQESEDLTALNRQHDATCTTGGST